MGLDSVELVIRFEDAFGITIPDEIAAQLTTPRKVTDYIATRVSISDQPSCLSQQAFYFIRGKFVAYLHLSRDDFRPGVLLENLVPKENRRFIWAGLKSELGAGAIPDLARPSWLFYLLTSSTLIASLYAVVYARANLSFGLGRALSLGLLVAVGTAYVGEVLTRPLKANFRQAYRHAGDLAKYVVLESPHIFKKRSRGWTREQIAAVVRELIVDETGTTDFTEDSHFISDLHLD
jgi:hypothetical protein